MDKKEFMFSMVAKWRQSGLTRTLFAKQNGLELPSFDYWCKKQYNEIEKAKLVPQFIEISSENNSAKNSDSISGQNQYRPQIEFDLPSGLRIKIY
jgi:hypothetical protein